MTLTINGAPRVIPDGITLFGLLRQEWDSDRGKAASVDGTVIPRSEWATWVLHDGDCVELLMAVQGG